MVILVRSSPVQSRVQSPDFTVTHIPGLLSLLWYYFLQYEACMQWWWLQPCLHANTVIHTIIIILGLHICRKGLAHVYLKARYHTLEVLPTLLFAPHDLWHLMKRICWRNRSWKQSSTNFFLEPSKTVWTMRSIARCLFRSSSSSSSMPY